MRDRLIELLDIIIQPGEKTLGDIADHLIANGVIVPPCKVGDTVYYLTTDYTQKELNVTDIFCGIVRLFEFDGTNILIFVKYTNGLFYYHKSTDLGKTVFLTKEVAEKALAERSGK